MWRNMRNKLKQYIPYAIISIPFVFFYWSVIVADYTYASKLTDIGFLSLFHIILGLIFYFGKKDFINTF